MTATYVVCEICNHGYWNNQIHIHGKYLPYVRTSLRYPRELEKLGSRALALYWMKTNEASMLHAWKRYCKIVELWQKAPRSENVLR